MTIDDACKQIAKELNEPIELVKQIVQFEFQFTREVMQDENDYHDVLFNKLFRFRLKPKFKNNKNEKEH